MNRLCIYPEDIMTIIGGSDRYGRNLIKKHLKKEAHQVVTVDEFCHCMGLLSKTASRQLW